MTRTIRSIHEKAIQFAKDFKKAETDLISILQEVKQKRVYLSFGFTNMFDYCTRGLGLTRDSSYTYLKIA